MIWPTVYSLEDCCKEKFLLTVCYLILVNDMHIAYQTINIVVYHYFFYFFTSSYSLLPILTQNAYMNPIDKRTTTVYTNQIMHLYIICFHSNTVILLSFLMLILIRKWILLFYAYLCFSIHTQIGPKAPIMVMAEADIVNGQFEIIVSWQVCKDSTMLTINLSVPGMWYTLSNSMILFK